MHAVFFAFLRVRLGVADSKQMGADISFLRKPIGK
jgi:hypothetical protein